MEHCKLLVVGHTSGLSSARMMRALGLWRQQQKQLLQGYAATVSACSQLSFDATDGPTQQVVPYCTSCQDIRLEAACPSIYTRGSATGGCTRQYATSAEFSGGAFTDTGESSSPDVNDQEPDDKQMLLEAALGFVVSFKFLLLATIQTEAQTFSRPLSPKRQ